MLQDDCARSERDSHPRPITATLAIEVLGKAIDRVSITQQDVEAQRQSLCTVVNSMCDTLVAVVGNYHNQALKDVNAASLSKEKQLKQTLTSSAQPSDKSWPSWSAATCPP